MVPQLHLNTYVLPLPLVAWKPQMLPHTTAVGILFGNNWTTVVLLSENNRKF